MLTDLRIENILLMDEVDVHFCDGFSVITGQTGAGKSILLDSLNIILGERVGSTILRDASNNGIITATFKISNKHIQSLLLDNGFLSNDKDDVIIIKKIITKNGGKIFINDIQTTLQFINTISSSLLEIYSQFEQTDLFSIKKHLDLLDKFGSFENDLQNIKLLYQDMKNEESRFEKTQMEIELQKENLEYLKSFIQDMEKLKLKPNEYDDLICKKKQMTDASKISTYINNAFNIVNDLKFGTYVNKIQTNLSHASQDLNDTDIYKDIENVNETLDKLYNDYQIVSEGISDMVNKYSFDETYLNEIEERVANINEIARKYQTTPIELEKQFVLAKDKLSKIEVSDEILQKLSAIVKEKQDKYYQFAKKLSEKRRNIAEKLEKDVLDKLERLKMDKVQFYTSFEDTEPTEYGIDKIVFFASMNPGLAPAPIHKIASGGELSRFMLAFKSALCGAQATNTIIFDEIDTGVSGSVAFAIGKELLRLSKSVQVICITHNSQTASYANHHLLVSKEQSLEKTRTIIKDLTEEEHIRAIAEMISGDTITEESINNAKKLIESAKMQVNQ